MASKIALSVVRSPTVTVSTMIHGGRVAEGRGREVGLDGVVDAADVAAGLAVAVDEDVRAGEEGGDPFGVDGGIGARGVLARAEDVETAPVRSYSGLPLRRSTGVRSRGHQGVGTRQKA